MKLFRFIPAGLILAVLTGCATQSNMPVPEGFWQNHQQKIAVTSITPPKPSLVQAGQTGLVDMAINCAVTDKFRKHLEATDVSWANRLPNEFAQKLKQRHIKAGVYQPLSQEPEDQYAGFAMRMKHDKVLVVKITSIGAVRQYYSFIPLGPPKAFCSLRGELYDPMTKQLLWRHTSMITQPVDGEWDQPPSYPNFSRALQVAVRSAQQELVDSFFSGN